jgi:hypothetical protein
MKFPLFSRRPDSISAHSAQDRAEKLLADSLRLLSQFCSKLADAVEAQRLARSGYSRQGEFLERTDGESTGDARH